MRRCDRFWSGQLESCRYPPLFIVGAPRSGTTLCYQAVVQGLKPAYICNAAARWRDCPQTATRIAIARGQMCTNFSSDCGRIKGGRAPSEAGEIWNQFFPKDPGPHYAASGAIGGVAMMRVRSLVAGIEAAFDRPFVNKNVKHSVRMLLLDELFQGCLFIVMRRDPIANATSLANAMIRHCDSLAQWWSVKPSNYQEYERDPWVERACKIIHFTQEDIERDRARIGSTRFLDLEYEQLCAHPSETMRLVSEFACRAGTPLTLVGNLPGAFDATPRPDRPKGTIARIISTFESLGHPLE